METKCFNQPTHHESFLPTECSLVENEEPEDKEVAMIDDVLQQQRVAEELAISTQP